MWKAKFRTAYDQREVVLDAVVSAKEPVSVGSLVKVTWDGTNPATLESVTGSSNLEALNAATHIVAQSDMTMEYGHVPVEFRNYKYSDAVANSVGNAVKKVALFKITEKDDVIVYNTEA